MSFVMNSLSTGLRVVSPRQVDDKGLLFRIELEDYGWDADKWNLLTAGLPLRRSSTTRTREMFPFDEDVERGDPRGDRGGHPVHPRATGSSPTPLIPPLYHQLLDLPGHGEPLSMLEDQLGINILENIAERGGGSRGLPRLASPRTPTASSSATSCPATRAPSGSATTSPTTSRRDRDIMVEPAQPRLRRWRGHLHAPERPPGLLRDRRLPPRRVSPAELNIAPIAVVKDPAAFDGQVITGLSCLTCHATVGIIPKTRRDPRPRAARTARATTSTRCSRSTPATTTCRTCSRRTRTATAPRSPPPA